MTISIKPTASGSTIEQDGSTILTVDGSGNITTAYNLSVSGTVSSTGDVVFDTDTLYVDVTNNRVGVGTSSPSATLHVFGGQSYVTGSSGAGAYTRWYNNAQTSSDLQIGQGWSSGSDNVGFVLNNANADLLFGTNGSERMRIDSSGNLLVGTTSGYDGGSGHTFKSPTNHFITTWRTTTSTGNYIHGFVSDVGGVGTAKYAIYANGTAGAISDENYKKNIELARDYLSDINQINIIKYNWKTDKEDANKEIGFSAQQVETIFPTMVDTVTASLEDGSEITHKMLKKDVFLPMAIKCIQELSAKIEALEARVATLEGN
jgi:hypothetical protein